MKLFQSLWSRRTGHLLGALVLAGMASSASAVATWTNLGTNCNGQGVSSGVAMGNSLSCGTSDGAALSVKGYSTNSGATSSGSAVKTAAVYNWGSSAGLGVVNSNENPGATGPHAIDNQYGTDMLLLNFGGVAVDLTKIQLGWTGSDTDFSLLVWTGSSAPSATDLNLTLTGSAATSSLGSWKVVSNYASATGFTDTSISTSYYSSYWLISAYDTSFGTALAAGDNGTLTAGGASNYDAFKVLAVTANTCSGTVKNNQCMSVPEPGSLALMGVAMIGLISTTRRRTAKKQA